MTWLDPRCASLDALCAQDPLKFPRAPHGSLKQKRLEATAQRMREKNITNHRKRLATLAAIQRKRAIIAPDTPA